MNEPQYTQAKVSQMRVEVLGNGVGFSMMYIIWGQRLMARSAGRKL